MFLIKRRTIIGVILIIFAAVFCFCMVLRQKHLETERIRKAEAASVAAEEESKRLAVEAEFELERTANKNEIFSFSKKEKNVVVIMLDRAVGCYFPYIMQELPETKKQFDGFTYYPNAASFGSSTIYGVPGVYGGYEYVPEAMNARKDEKLSDKHNEALKLLPTIFSQNGYKVVFCDPPMANYQWVSDLSIFDDIENCKTFTFLGTGALESGADTQYQKFMVNYNFLNELSSRTNNRSRKGTYIAIDNEITHRYTILKWPEYEPIGPYGFVGSTQRVFSQDEKIYLYETTQISHYHVNACAMKLLGNWFDYLRELGVYDNTRIIITSDHGYKVNQYSDMHYGEEDLLYFNCLLLFKDFDCDEPLKFDNTLMTNADTPILATEGLIEDATNPFTGKLLKDSVQKDEIHAYAGHNWRVETNRGNTFGNNLYYSFHDNFFDRNNWSLKRINPPEETG